MRVARAPARVPGFFTKLFVQFSLLNSIRLFQAISTDRNKELGFDISHTMANQCDICGRFSGQTAKTDLWIRGLDRRADTTRVDIDVSSVSVGECCGLGMLQNPDEARVDRTYQPYLNSTPDGEMRYVVMIRDEIETDSDTEEVEIDTNSVQLHPITENHLPESIDSYVVGKVD